MLPVSNRRKRPAGGPSLSRHCYTTNVRFHKLIIIRDHSVTDCSLLDGFHFFLEFLKTEYSQENLDFWTECEEFQKTTNRAKALTKANNIYTTYVQDGGLREVKRHLDTIYLSPAK